MKSTSWKGAPFFVESYELGETSQEKEVRVLSAVKRVSSLSAMGASLLLFVAMLQSSTWIGGTATVDAEKAENADVAAVARAFVGPAGVFLNAERLSFFDCPELDRVDPGARAWMQHYGVCASRPDSPALWWWTMLFGWCAVIMTCLGPALGLAFRILIRVEAAMVLAGAMCALSAMICFLNWNYVADMLFEQALVIAPAQSEGPAKSPVIMVGPVRMWLHWPFWCFLIGFFTCFFALISLTVVAKSGLRDALVRSD